MPTKPAKRPPVRRPDLAAIVVAAFVGIIGYLSLEIPEMLWTIVALIVRMVWWQLLLLRHACPWECVVCRRLAAYVVTSRPALVYRAQV